MFNQTVRCVVIVGMYFVVKVCISSESKHQSVYVQWL